MAKIIIEITRHDASIDPEGKATTEERQRYYDALIKRIETEYPDADVRVMLWQQSDPGTRAYGELYYDAIKSEIRLLAQAVWEEWLETI